MNKELLLDMYYAAPELWYIVLALIIILIVAAVRNTIRMVLLRKENYFLRRDKERLAETLYASKDGYFCYIYTDETYDNQIIERCSRRLAIILNLPHGIESSLAEVLKSFYKDDAEKINKYINLLREDGVSFENQFLIKSGKILNLNGARISGSDGTVYSDIIWFRDVSNIAEYVNSLNNEKALAQSNLRNLEDLVDNLPYPVWMRNHNLNLVMVNKKYLEFANYTDKETVIINNIEIPGISEDIKLKDLAKEAKDTNKVRKKSLHLNKNGNHHCFEVIETPYLSEESLDRIATVGSLIDVTALDNLKRNLKQYQNAHLEILGALGTAFAVYDNSYNLDFYNQAFVHMWDIDENWLEKNRSYTNFLDYLREQRLLPEVPDYIYYKTEEHKMFNNLVETTEDLLHLPDGRSFRRLRAPHPKGGLIFAFEDISDRLAARRDYNLILSVQQEILDNLEQAILIFGSNGKLKFYNQAYVELWDADEIILQKEPTIAEVIETHKNFFDAAENWSELKKQITHHVLNNNTKAFIVTRRDGSEIECISALLANESVMVIMKKINNL